MAHAHVARILGITTGCGRHAVLRKLVKKLGSVAHSGRAHRRRWHGAQRHRFQPRIKSRRCCASAARFKPIFKQTASCPDAARFLSELNIKKNGMGGEAQKLQGEGMRRQVPTALAAARRAPVATGAAAARQPHRPQPRTALADRLEQE